MKHNIDTPNNNGDCNTMLEKIYDNKAIVETALISLSLIFAVFSITTDLHPALLVSWAATLLAFLFLVFTEYDSPEDHAKTLVEKGDREIIKVKVLE